MAKMISLFGSVSSSRSELMRVGEVQCHWLTLNEAFIARSFWKKSKFKILEISTNFPNSLKNFHEFSEFFF